MTIETKSIPFTVIGDHGRVLSTGFSMILPPESAGVVLEQQAPSIDHWWNGEAFVDKGPQPSVHHIFDWPTHQWVDPRDLGAWKAQKWDEVKAARETALAAGLVVGNLGRFDTDATAALNITGVYAALDAMPEGWTIDWTRFDNTSITLAKEQFREMALAVLTYNASVHATGRMLRDQINAAGAVGELVGIRWPE